MKIAINALGLYVTMGYNMPMMRFGLFVRGKRNELDLSQDELAAKCPMDRKTVGRIERVEKIEDVDPQMLVLLAHGFGVDPATLAKEFAQRSERLDRRKDILASSDERVAAGRPMGASPYRSQPHDGVPVFNKTPAGRAVDYRDVGANLHDRLAISIEAVGDPDAFALQIVGNSMDPTWREGDFAIFAPRAQWEDYDECFVQFNGERDEANTFKRVRNLPGGQLELIPNNTRDYKPEIVQWEDHVGGNGGCVVRVVKCVGRYERKAWKPKPLYRNLRQNDDDLPVIQR